MLTELCQELRNWFDKERHYGTFTIENGNIVADFLQPGQYFRIVGSIFSDGVYQYPTEDRPDETFNGAVWALAIPKEVLQLDEEIDAWRAKYEDVSSPAMSPFTSESLFTDYSYSKGGSANSSSGGSATVSWKNAFKSRLKDYRRFLPT